MGKGHQSFLEKTKEAKQILWSDETGLFQQSRCGSAPDLMFLQLRCGSAPDLMCREGQTSQTHLCLLSRWQPLLGTNIIKKVIWRILQSPGTQTLPGTCQQPVMLTGNPAGWDCVKYLVCWQNWTAVVLCPLKGRGEKLHLCTWQLMRQWVTLLGKKIPSIRRDRGKGLCLYLGVREMDWAWLQILHVKLTLFRVS